MSAQNEPVANSQQLPTITVLGESAYAGWGGSGQGLTLDVNNGTLPQAAGESYADLPVYRLLVEGDPSQGGWWNLLIAGQDWEGYSIAPYVADGFLEMNVRLSSGQENFLISLTDVVPGRDPLNLPSNEVELAAYAQPITTWQTIRIPLSDLVNNSGGFNPGQILSVSLTGIDSNLIDVGINNLRFTSESSEPSTPPFKLNQLGYMPNSIKSMRVSGFPDEFTLEAGTPFEIRSLSDNSVAYTGTLEELTPLDAVASGERVLQADFDELTASDEYYLAVDAYQIADSEPFRVGTEIYGELLSDSVRYFYLQRSGIPIEAAYAGEFARGVGHPQDASVSLQSGEKSGIDVSGGWYDAGDFGKYVNAGATSVSDFLWAWEMFPDSFIDGQFNIPESGNGIPDLLDEARWELEWILKMQDPDSGGFYHMVQPTEEDAADTSTYERYIVDQADGRSNVRPTSTSASAVAALAHGALIFEPIDAAFAAEMAAGAEAGWAYLEANPNGVAPLSGPYSDAFDLDNRFWAATSLYRLTGEPLYHEYIKSVYQEVPTLFRSTSDNAYGVNDMGMIGWLPYLYAVETDPALLSFFQEEFEIWSSHMLGRWEASVWGHTLLDEDYYWGSNYVVVTTPLVMYIGADALGNEGIKNNARLISQTGLDYLLGTNPLSFSYVSGYGGNSVANLYSVQWSADTVPNDPPGVLVGGPNVYTNPLLPTNFAGKAYLDGNSFWTLNEHTIYWNSAMVFSVAMQVDDAGEVSPVVSAIEVAPTPTSTTAIESEPSAEAVESEPTAVPTGEEEEAVAVVPEESSRESVSAESEQATGPDNSIYQTLVVILSVVVVMLGIGMGLLWRRIRQIERS
ncbi:MAG: glycoside hydrolase family 9 protein [Chloroflexota bacterium]